MSYISGHITYLFSIIFLLFFDSFYLFINVVVYSYIFSNFPPSLLPFHLPTTININITFFYPFIFLLFWLFLSPSFYYKFANLFHSIHILSHKKVITLSLFLVFFFSFFGIFFKIVFASLLYIDKFPCSLELYYSLSLSLSLSLSHTYIYIYIFFFCMDFFYLFFISLLLVDEFVCSLKLYFRLMHTPIKNK